MAVPSLNRLEAFPSVLTLSPRTSESFTSGANVTSPEAGTVTMRFQLPGGWTFTNGMSEQRTSLPFSALQTRSMRMNWSAISATGNDTTVALTVIVSLDGHQGQQQQSTVMQVRIAAAETKVAAATEAAEAATPALNQLEQFPSEIVLYRSGNHLRSDPFNSGASVTSDDAGNMVMRFDAPPGYTFDNGTSQQATVRAFAARETASMRMSWRLSTPQASTPNIGVVVTVSMQAGGGQESRTATMAVKIATLTERIMHRLRALMGE
jgi:hypothetical protein